MNRFKAMRREQVRKYCNDLNLPAKTRKKALKCLSLIEKRFNFGGKSPRCMVGLVMVIAEMDGKWHRLTEMAELSGMSTSTVKKYYNAFKGIIEGAK